MTMCRAAQPVLGVAEPLSSTALRKACRVNGLSAPAHASQSAALMSLAAAIRRAVIGEGGSASAIGGVLRGWGIARAWERGRGALVADALHTVWSGQTYC